MLKKRLPPGSTNNFIFQLHGEIFLDVAVILKESFYECKIAYLPFIKGELVSEYRIYINRLIAINNSIYESAKQFMNEEKILLDKLSKGLPGDIGAKEWCFPTTKPIIGYCIGENTPEEEIGFVINAFINTVDVEKSASLIISGCYDPLVFHSLMIDIPQLYCVRINRIYGKLPLVSNHLSSVLIISPAAFENIGREYIYHPNAYVVSFESKCIIANFKSSEGRSIVITNGLLPQMELGDGKENCKCGGKSDLFHLLSFYE